jgi:cobalt transporter subunit CbtB
LGVHEKAGRMNAAKTTHILADPFVSAAALPRSVLYSAVAATLGLFMLWGVGFSANGALHETAHDTRHALGFPCH